MADERASTGICVKPVDPSALRRCSSLQRRSRSRKIQSGAGWAILRHDVDGAPVRQQRNSKVVTEKNNGRVGRPDADVYSMHSERALYCCMSRLGWLSFGSQ